MYSPLMQTGKFADAFTIYDQVQTACLKVNRGDLLPVNRANYAEAYNRTLRDGMSDAILKSICTWLAKTPENLVPSDGQIYLEMGRRVYWPLYSAGNVKDANVSHDTIQSILEKIGTPEQRQLDTQRYLDARIGSLERIQPAQFCVQVQSLINEMEKNPTGMDMAFVGYYGRQLYNPLMSANKYADIRSIHQQMQTLCVKTNHPELALADQEAYVRVGMQAVMDPKANVLLEDYITWLREEPNQLTPVEVQWRLDLASRIYDTLCTAGRLDESGTIHKAVQEILTKMGTPEQLRADTSVYITALQRSAGVMLVAPTTTVTQRELLKKLCAEVWDSSPLLTLDTVLPLVRDKLMASPQTVDWLPAYARLVGMIPEAEPSRPLALLLLGQWSQRQTATARMLGNNAADLEKQAEQAFLALIKGYPKDGNISTALTRLTILYQDANRVTDVEALIHDLPMGQLQTDALAWVADTYFTRGTLEGYEKALPTYTMVLTQAPANTQCPIWQFKVARCYEQAGKITEAITAYQHVIDTYPDASVVVAAMHKLIQLKGAQR